MRRICTLILMLSLAWGGGIIFHYIVFAMKVYACMSSVVVYPHSHGFQAGSILQRFSTLDAAEISKVTFDSASSNSAKSIKWFKG